MAGNRVWVAGSINVDLVARVGRFPAAGETVLGSRFDVFPGGKGANQAVAVARLGVPCSLLAAIGEDDFGALAMGFLRRQDIDLGRIKAIPELRTGCALITVSDSDNSIVVIPGANAELSADEMATLPCNPGDVLLAQLETPTAATAVFFALGRKRGARTILNGAPAVAEGRQLLPLCDILVLNEVELAYFADQAAGSSVADADVHSAMRKLQTSREQTIVVTLGHEGVAALHAERFLRIAARPVTVVDTTGAGDSFTGALAAQMALGQPFESALRYANVAASLTVLQPGAGPSMPSAKSVRWALAESPEEFI